MIYYFSATGNSKYVAERIAEETGDQTISIVPINRQNDYSYSIEVNESVGFVFPTYFYGLPTLIVDFLEKLELTNAEGAYIYLVLTCGSSTAYAGRMFEKLLDQRGYSLSAQFAVRMTDNYVPMFKLASPEKTKQLLENADKKVDELSNEILQRTVGDKNEVKGFLPKFMTAVLYPLYKNGMKTAIQYGKKTQKRGQYINPNVKL